jgi:hypothetical protein
MSRHVPAWGLALLLATRAGAVWGASVDDADLQQLQRVAAIEDALGFTPPLEQSLCVDGAQGQRPLHIPLDQRSEDKLRHDFEQCQLAAADARADGAEAGARDDTHRLVSQVRAIFVERVARLQPLRAALEKCRAAPTPAAASACVAQVIGRPASDAEVAALAPAKLPK